jgi:hypothetical protein
MADQADSRGKDGRWSLEGTTALVTGGTKGIGFVSLCMLSLFLAFMSASQKEICCLYGFGFTSFETNGGVFNCVCIYI